MAVQDSDNLSPVIRKPVIWGCVVLGAFVSVFIGWGASAQLTKAVVASGVIAPTMHTYTVQHQTGGTIGRILVSDGTRVGVGDVLVTLSDTELRAEEFGVKAEAARLIAERQRRASEVAGVADVAFSPSLRALVGELELPGILQIERQRFDEGAIKRANDKALLQASVAGLREVVASFERSLSARRQEERHALGRLEALRKLAGTGYMASNELRQFEQAHARLVATKAEAASNLALRKRELAERTLALNAFDQGFHVETLERIAALDISINQRQARLAIIAQRLAGMTVRSPFAGTVSNLRFHTRGATLAPGAAILELVPNVTQASVDVRVSPGDVGRVQRGLPAQIVLSAFPNRDVPRVDAVVETVSADRLTDRVTGAAFYAVRLNLDHGSLVEARHRSGRELRLVAGMPAQALIATGSDTMLGYLVAPLRSSLRRAFSDE